MFVAFTRIDIGYAAVQNAASIIAAITGFLAWYQSKRNGKTADNTNVEVKQTRAELQENTETTKKVDRQTNGGLTKTIETVLDEKLKQFVARDELTKLIQDAAADAVSEAAAHAAKEALVVIKTESPLKVQT